MKAVIEPGLAAAPRRPATARRHSPSTLRNRGLARASISTICRSCAFGSARTSSGREAVQKKQADLGGSGSPARAMRSAQSARVQPHSRKG